MCVDYDTRVAKHCREPTAEEVSDKTQAKLARLGIATLRDLLLFFPRRYEDFSSITPIAFT